MKTRSNRYKVRNLPENYPVKDVIKNKPVFAMFVFMLIGGVMIFSTKYALIGAVFALVGGYTLFFAENKVSVEFSQDFMVVYLAEQEEECFLIYYNEIESYKYCAKMYQTDEVQIITKDRKMFEFKSLDRRKMKKFLKAYLTKENDKK